MTGPIPARLDQMQAWATGLMASRPPDFVVGDDFMRRWFVVPYNPVANVYLHEFRCSDDDRALHDHPWDNATFVILGRYVEETSITRVYRKAGDFVQRRAASLHRIELVDDRPAITLFTTGPKIRDWGFACPQGWVPWQEYCAPGDGGRIGKGCGQ